jgi:Ca2+-binding RTX toxin-like protein
MVLSGAAYHAFVVANDSIGFKNAVFSGADTITGSNVTDYLMGYAGNDTINGLDGDDIIDGGTGADKMVGGKGDDVYLVDNAGDTTKDGGGSTADMIIATINLDMNKAAYLGVEQVVLDGNANLYAYGNLFGNKIYGNDGSNTLKGNAGDDEIWGGDGNDKLDGGSGDDQMHGGAGNDTYTVDSTGDLADDSDGFGTDLGGIDTVNSSAISTFLTDFVENLVLTGTAADGFGNALDNKITGNGQVNVLNGGAGADTLIGGAGSDYYTVDDSNDKISETSTGGVADRVYASATYTLSSYDRGAGDDRRRFDRRHRQQLGQPHLWQWRRQRDRRPLGQ